MEKRSVELEIKLRNAKSISDLETVLKEINTDLKSVDVNSEAFDQLSDAAKRADNQLKNIKEDLKGISDSKQLDSVAKLGGALAASMSVATVAAAQFGEQTQESVQKAIQTATQLNVVISSIKPIMEGLSSSNRKAFSTFIQGFKESAIGAKLFGTTTRAAIAATGIGLLVVAIGTLIANWDLVVEKAKEFKDVLLFIAPPIGLLMEALDFIEKKFGSISNLMAGLTAGFKALFTVGKNAAEEFNKAVQDAKNNDAQRTILENLEKQVDQMNNLIAINKALGKSENENFNAKKAYLETSISALEKITKKTDEENKLLEKQKHELQLLTIEQGKYNEELRKTAFFKSAEAFNAELKRLEILAQIRAEDEQRFQDDFEQTSKLTLERWEQELEVLKNRAAAIEDSEQEVADVLEISDQERFDRIARGLKRIQREEQEQLKERLDLQIAYYKSLDNLSEDQQEVLAELQAERFELIQGDIEKIAEFVQLGVDAIGQISNAITNALQTKIDGLTTQLNSFNMMFQESVANVQSLEAQLADAEGARRESILEQIEDERKSQKKLADERKKVQNEIIKAQNKQNKIEYANNLLNAIVQTALAVTQALPNIPLSVAVGILGGIQSGIVAANPPEAIPLMASGGYTQAIGGKDSTGYRVAGIVHENEYVVPEKVMQTQFGSYLVKTLEAMRISMPTFADGGFTSTNVPSQPITDLSLSPSSIKSAIEQARIFVSVQEIRDTQTNVEVIESRASI